METKVTTIAASTGKPDKRMKYFDVAKALKLRLKHKLSYEAIAEKMGASRTHVMDKLGPLVRVLENPSVVEAYTANRADVLNAVEAKLVTEIVAPDKLEKASLNNVAYAYQQINNARRLEQGQATTHVAFADISDALAEARRKREALEEELANFGRYGVVDDDDAYISPPSDSGPSDDFDALPDVLADQQVSVAPLNELPAPTPVQYIFQRNPGQPYVRPAAPVAPGPPAAPTELERQLAELMAAMVPK